MKIVSWNVNGLRSVLAKGLADFILAEQPDVLCLQEIKCNLANFMDEQFEALHYDCAYNPAVKPGYSGTLTAWKKGLDFKVGDHVSSVPLSAIFHDEGRVTLIQNEKFSILNLYVPSGTSSEERHSLKLDFLDELRVFLENYPKKSLELIVCGDFNVCHQDIDIHHPVEARKKNLSGFRDDEREKFSKIIDTYLWDIYRIHNPQTKEYSWWSYRAGARKKNLGWRIDYFLVSEGLKGKIGRARILTEVQGSDHCPLLISLG